MTLSLVYEMNLLQRHFVSIGAIILAAVSLAPPMAGLAQGQEKQYSVALKGNFTSSSRLFYNIEAADELLRSQYLSFDGIFGIGIDLRRTIEETRLQLGISAEYLSATQTSVRRDRVPVEDGYWTVPVELTGYFIIPFSSSTIRLYIGGGAGIYFGERRYSVADESASILGTEKGVGIHVLTGVEYAFFDWLAIRSEVKFRDLQFESTNAFTKSSVNYQGTQLQLNQTPVRSRVNIDGMVINADVVVRF